MTCGWSRLASLQAKPAVATVKAPTNSRKKELEEKIREKEEREARLYEDRKARIQNADLDGRYCARDALSEQSADAGHGREVEG